MLGFSALSEVAVGELPGGGYPASGALAAFFGSPFAVIDHIGTVTPASPVAVPSPGTTRAELVSGFAPSIAPDPSSRLYHPVDGLLAVTFGDSRVFPYGVPGTLSATFGTPIGWQFWRTATVGNVSHFGTPSTPVDLSLSVNGANQSHFGQPFAFNSIPPNTNIRAQAFGWVSENFGKPRAALSLSGEASWFMPVLFAPATAVSIHAVPGVYPVAHGSNSASVTAIVTGFTAVTASSPISTRAQQAGTAGCRSWFGGITGRFSDHYQVKGVMLTRIGQPKGYSRNTYPVGGLYQVAFGVALASEENLVSSASYVCRFGKPILRRSAQC